MCVHHGIILAPEEGDWRHNELEAVGDSRSFIFDAKSGKDEWSIDTTHEDGRMGRLINHSMKEPNVCPVVVVVGGK